MGGPARGQDGGLWTGSWHTQLSLLLGWPEARPFLSPESPEAGAVSSVLVAQRRVASGCRVLVGVRHEEAGSVCRTRGKRCYLSQNLYESIKNEPFKIPEDDGNDLTHTFFNPDREGWLLKLGEAPPLSPDSAL